ncbi:MAG: murein tripeptide amidase MpaA [Gemmatimonadota bacterium]|jgi:protein MpaA
MRFRPEKEIGTIPFEPVSYGRSHMGIPLEVWLPSGTCRMLIHAGIHGEEGETTVALSRALRLLVEPSPKCAVVLAANPDGLIRGTRGNARGVDLNRNFPTADWSPEPVGHRSTLDAPRAVELSPGSGPGSEPETRALIQLVEELEPEVVVALHAPLACIDDDELGTLAQWLSEKSGLPLVSDVGYPTPGSFGTWGGEKGIGVVTYEFPLTDNDTLVREHVPILAELVAGDCSWF